MNINRIPRDAAGSDERGDATQSPDESPRVLCRDHYLGLLAWIDARDGEGGRAMAGSECTIGCRLGIDFSDDGGVTLLSPRSTMLGSLSPDDAAAVNSCRERGWDVEARLELVAWSQEDGAWSGEIAIVCRDGSDPEIATALEGFSKRLATRIRGGDHPSPALSQGQFEKVLESGGQWCLTDPAPLPSKNGGKTVFRRHQTFTDKLVEASMEHRAGCTVASFAALAVIVAAIVALVMLLL